MKLRRVFSCMMALLLAASLPLTAYADTWYLDDGDITVSATESGQTVSQGAKSIDDDAPIITQAGREASTTNTVTITAEENATANVTLDGVMISTDGSAIQILGNGDVVIELDGANIVLSGANHAGVEKNDADGTGNLTITDENETAGSLIAIGGEDAAGIGGGYESSTSNITISGGTVDATGGDAPCYETEDGIVTGEGGGAGIGGGTWGSGDNIKIENDANVTATGKGNAADIGNGHGHPEDLGSEYENDPTKKQPDKVDVDGLYTTGSVNGQSGTKEPPKNNDNDQSGTEEPPKNNDNGQSGTEQPPKDNDNNQSGTEQPPENNDNDQSGTKEPPKNNDSSQSSGGSSPTKPVMPSSIPSMGGSSKSWSDVAADLGGLKVSDNNGNDLSDVVWLKEDSLNITAAKDNVLVGGTLKDVETLKLQGINQINLETNLVNVSVSNDLLMKTTNAGESFQLTADDTTVNLTATDQNNKKTLDLTLTANRPSGAQESQSSKKPVSVSIDSQSNTGNNSEGNTLQLKTDATDATLTYSEKSAQSLMNSDFRNLALTTAETFVTVESQLAASTTVNGSGSISIGDTSVRMNGFQFSAEDSSENDKLADLVNNINLKMENPSQTGSAVAVTVDAKASLSSASLELTGSALQSLVKQDIEKTAITVGEDTFSFNNSEVLKKIDDSRLDSTRVNLRIQNLVVHRPNDETETWVEKVDEDGNVTVLVDSL